MGQLAVELLLGALRPRPRLAGALESELVLPCAGYGPRGQLAFPLEVHQCGEGGGVALLQQRAPVAAVRAGPRLRLLLLLASAPRS